MSSLEVSYSFLTPQSFLERSAYVFRNKHAVVYRQQQWAYPEFAARVNQLASALRGWGLRKGDRVAFLCPNIPPLLEAHFGVPLAGGVLVAMNTRLSPDDIRHILNDCGARLLWRQHLHYRGGTDDLQTPCCARGGCHRHPGRKTG